MQIRKKKINHLMYMDDLKPFVKKKASEILIQTLGIYSQDIGMEISI